MINDIKCGTAKDYRRFNKFDKTDFSKNIFPKYWEIHSILGKYKDVKRGNRSVFWKKFTGATYAQILRSLEAGQSWHAMP